MEEVQLETCLNIITLYEVNERVREIKASNATENYGVFFRSPLPPSPESPGVSSAGLEQRKQ